MAEGSGFVPGGQGDAARRERHLFQGTCIIDPGAVSRLGMSGKAQQVRAALPLWTQPQLPQSRMACAILLARHQSRGCVSTM